MDEARAKPDAVALARANALEGATAGAALALVAVTFPLWLPHAQFPQVPLFSWGAKVPRWCDSVGLVALMCGPAAVVTAWGIVVHGRATCVVERLKVCGWMAFLLAAGGLVLLDQHRWQAWLWQFAVLAVVFAAAPRERVIPLARILAISVYVHSAISKLDQSFLDTHGRELTDAFLEAVGAAPRGSSAVALALPVGELLTAFALGLPRLRFAGLILSIGMHATLLVALGPLGLGHKPGVLLWNAYFLVHNLIVFGGGRVVEAPASAKHSPTSPLTLSTRRAGEGGVAASDGLRPGVAACRLAEVVVFGVVILPILAPFRLLDPWLGWGVYASRPERIRLHVLERAVDRLPETLRPHVEPAPPLGEWRRVRLDRWSLEATGAPISPQARFSIGVARAVVEAQLDKDEIRIDRESAADWRTGRRTTRVYTGAGALERAAEDFVLSTEPR